MADRGISAEISGLTETLKAFQGLEADLRKQANAELRQAARTCATELAGELKIAAAGSGVPVAPRVASSIRVKSDRLPVVTVGGNRRVGVRGGSAASLVWGSERGPRGAVNHFGVAPSSGYWIRPTVTRFRGSRAVQVYLRSIADLMKRHGLL